MGLFLALILFFSFPAFAHANTKDGLVAWWKFDEDSGNAIDSSGSGNDGTPTGTVIYKTGCATGGCRYFVTTDSIAISNVSTDVGTLSFWAKGNFSVDPSATYAILNGTAGGNNFKVALSTFATVNNWFSSYRGSFGSQVDSYVNPDYTLDSQIQTWQHVVFTWDVSSGSQWYVNGVKEETWSITTGSFAAMTWTIGNNFDGWIDDIRLYNRRLNDQEAYNLYNVINNRIRNATIQNAVINQ